MSRPFLNFVFSSAFCGLAKAKPITALAILLFNFFMLATACAFFKTTSFFEFAAFVVLLIALGFLAILFVNMSGEASK